MVLLAKCGSVVARSCESGGVKYLFPPSFFPRCVCQKIWRSALASRTWVKGSTEKGIKRM